MSSNEVLEFYIEVHPKEKSLMNQNWGLDNLLFFNNYGGIWELYTYKVITKLKKHLENLFVVRNFNLLILGNHS